MPHHHCVLPRIFHNHHSPRYSGLLPDRVPSRSRNQHLVTVPSNNHSFYHLHHWMHWWCWPFALSIATVGCSLLFAVHHSNISVHHIGSIRADSKVCCQHIRAWTRPCRDLRWWLRLRWRVALTRNRFVIVAPAQLASRVTTRNLCLHCESVLCLVNCCIVSELQQLAFPSTMLKSAKLSKIIYF